MKKLQYVLSALLISFISISWIYAETTTELKCDKIGTTNEGWYYSDGTLYKWGVCSSSNASDSTGDNDGNDLSKLKCDKIGTRSEGWYFSDGSFYKWANCSKNEEVKNTKNELEKPKEERSFSGAVLKPWIKPSFSGALNNEQVQKMKEEINKLKDEKQKAIEANKEKIKENRDSLKTAREEIKSGSRLTDEQKQKIKVLNEAMKTELAPLVKALRQEKDLEKRKALIEVISTINKKYAEQIKAIAGTNEVVGDFIDKKIAVLDANKELRQENLDTREQARVQKSALVEKYKTAFMGKLKSRLDNISSDKLEKVLEKVNTMIKTTTNNTKLSATSKENLLSQLEALKEIIENKIDEATIVNDEINLDSLFQ